MFFSISPRCHNRHREHTFFKQNKCFSCLPSENCQIEFGSSAMGTLSNAALRRHMCVFHILEEHMRIEHLKLLDFVEWVRLHALQRCARFYFDQYPGKFFKPIDPKPHFSFRFDIMQLNYPVSEICVVVVVLVIVTATHLCCSLNKIRHPFSEWSVDQITINGKLKKKNICNRNRSPRVIIIVSQRRWLRRKKRPKTIC